MSDRRMFILIFGTVTALAAATLILTTTVSFVRLQGSWRMDSDPRVYLRVDRDATARWADFSRDPGVGRSGRARFIIAAGEMFSLGDAPWGDLGLRRFRVSEDRLYFLTESGKPTLTFSRVPSLPAAPPDWPRVEEPPAEKADIFLFLAEGPGRQAIASALAARGVDYRPSQWTLTVIGSGVDPSTNAWAAAIALTSGPKRDPKRHQVLVWLTRPAKTGGMHVAAVDVLR